MARVLYRKYRSRGFDEVIGQEHITRTLQNAVASGSIAHAYLFTGPRGVGKTSVARILAHTINGLDYKKDAAHLDIIEIDAASNRRIDEIRDLREKVHIAPAVAKYKVYIIDEVHMLTNEAFNALLKTLEEPPEHVIFILATTEAHKVPETIVSRTQRFAFHAIEPAIMVQQLSSIAKQEKLKIDKPALEMVAEHARGSFRDALSLLDQLRGHGDSLDSEAVEKLLGLPPQALLTELLETLLRSELRQVFEQLQSILQRGTAAHTVARGLSKLCRDKLLEEPELLPRLLPLMERLLAVESSLEPHLQLEIALAAGLPADTDRPQPVRRKEATPKETSKTVSEAKVAPKKTAVRKSGLSFDWPVLLAAVKERSDPLYALLRMATPEYDAGSNTLKLKFRFAFHAKRVKTEGQQTLFLDVLSEHTEPTPVIEIVHDETVPADQSHETLEQVADILGGEVIEL